MSLILVIFLSLTSNQCILNSANIRNLIIKKQSHTGSSEQIIYKKVPTPWIKIEKKPN